MAPPQAISWPGRASEQGSPALTLLKASRVSSPPSSTAILQRASCSPATGYPGEREGPRPLLSSSTTSHPSPPALQPTGGMLNPPLPACDGASDHKPGNAGREPPLQRLRKPLHSGTQAGTSGEVECWHWPCLLLLGASQGCPPNLFPHPQGGNKPPLWECVDSP